MSYDMLHNAARISQDQSIFFRLPREICDEIYEYALGVNPTCHVHNGLRIGTVHRSSYYHNTFITNYQLKLVSGLPQRILGSKRICSEALGAFGQTRKCLAIKYKKPTRKTTRLLYALFQNAVLFRPGVVQKFEVL